MFADGGDQSIEIHATGRFGWRSIHCGFDCATGFVAHDDQKFGSEMFGCVFNTCDGRGSDDVAGHPYHKELAKTLVKDQLRRHARV